MLDDIDAGALRHTADDEPGVQRTGTSRFRYVDERSGARVTSTTTLARIEELVIPPAWGQVWICGDDRGHIQATGRDVKGRKQYRYHPAYRRMREAEKFADLVPFGEAVGPLRMAVADDLQGRGWTRERLLALVITLLDRTAVRIGNAEYARTNKTFGLTTLRQDHVSVGEEVVRFCFVGKAAKEHEVELEDPALARAVRSCRQLPGQLLFQWKDAEGALHPVRSDDVNLRLRQLTGLDVTAKTFRTCTRRSPPPTGRAASATGGATARPGRPAVCTSRSDGLSACCARPAGRGWSRGRRCAGGARRRPEPGGVRPAAGGYPTTMAFPSSRLSPQDAADVCELLQHRLIALIDLQLTLKHVHWNVVGSSFIGVHQMLDPQVDSVSAMVDQTAERIATLGGEPLGTPGAIEKGRTWDDYSVQRADAIAHLSALDLVYAGVLGDHGKAIERLEALDPVTQDMVIEQTEALEMHQWFVRAHLADKGGNLANAGAHTEQEAVEAIESQS